MAHPIMPDTGSFASPIVSLIVADVWAEALTVNPQATVKLDLQYAQGKMSGSEYTNELVCVCAGV